MFARVPFGPEEHVDIQSISDCCGIIAYMQKKSTKTAYLLWLPSLLGVAGIHRFYLGKTGTGTMWLLTLGLLGVGSIVDVFTLGKQVDKANANLTPKSKRENIIDAAIAVGLVFIAITFVYPVIGIAVHCEIKTSRLEAEAETTRAKLENINIDAQSISAVPNGDCLTGSGITYSFFVNKSFSSHKEAQQYILQELQDAGIPAPSPDTSPYFTSGWDGYDRTGGSSPISQIETDFYQLRLRSELAETVECQSFGGGIVCNGQDRKSAEKAIIENAPINSIEVSGDIDVETD